MFKGGCNGGGGGGRGGVRAWCKRVVYLLKYPEQREALGLSKTTTTLHSTVWGDAVPCHHCHYCCYRCCYHHHWSIATL